MVFKPLHDPDRGLGNAFELLGPLVVLIPILAGMSAAYRISHKAVTGSAAAPGYRPVSGSTSALVADDIGGNVLIIIADDLGNDKVGVYNEGDDDTRPPTPNIDGLAAVGVRFTNAYSNPVSSPTRATILTGKYGFDTGIGKNVRSADTFQLAYPPTHNSIPKVLTFVSPSYDSVHLGKWHLASDEFFGPGDALGHWFGWTEGSQRNIPNYRNWPKQTNGGIVQTTLYATTDTVDDAVTQVGILDEPWFLWVAFNAPHKPFHYPPAGLHSQPLGLGSVVKYAAMVEAMDNEIGRLLEDIDLADTTVIFISDNGTPKAVTMSPMDPDRVKKTVYEGGVNVPLIVAGKAVPDLSKGTVSSALVNSTDLWATVAEIAGSTDSEANSISIVPLLISPSSSGSRDHAYSERFIPNRLSGPYTLYDQALRDSRWKLIRKFDGSATTEEFFDLDAAFPGLDGTDLCPCPGSLGLEELAAYNDLSTQLNFMGGP